MWRAGIFKVGTVPDLRTERSGVAESGLSPSVAGFTLIDLLVILSILSITLSFVIPRLMGREEAELRSAARNLLYTVRRISDSAVFKKDKQVLIVDMDNNEYGKADDGRMSKLPPGVSMDRLQIGKEEIRRGRASITIFASGFRDEAKIHLAGKGKGYTVAIPALGERFEILEE